MEEKSISKVTKIRMIVLTAILFLVAMGGVTYAYFTINIIGNDTASSMRLKTKNLSLIYTDIEVRSGTGVRPGWSQTKTLTVENDGTSTATYNIIWKELYNELESDELIVSATCTSSVSGNTCEGFEKVVPYTPEEMNNLSIKRGIEIETGEIHTYTLTLSFSEKSSLQNYNQRKEFYGTINIGEGVEPATATLLTDQGTTGLDRGDTVRLSRTGIENQDFYVLSTNASETVLLAKYNLYVGNIYSDLGITLVKRLTPSDVGYGLQSAQAVGYDMANSVAVATVPFSNTKYWDSYNSTQLANIYNANLSSTEDWSNSGYSIAYYVEEYINTLGINGTGRLYLASERNASYDNHTTYWFANANNDGSLNGMFNYYGEATFVSGISDYDDPTFYAVRPVIEISTSDIQTP